MQTFHLRAARYSLYVLFPCLALHFLNEHVIGGDTPCSIDNFLMFLVLLINKFVYIDISRKIKYNKMLYQGELDLQLNQPTLDNECMYIYSSNLFRTPFHSNTSTTHQVLWKMLPFSGDIWPFLVWFVEMLQF